MSRKKVNVKRERVKPISIPTRLILNGKDMGAFPSRTKARLAAKRLGGNVAFRKDNLNGDTIIAETK